MTAATFNAYWQLNWPGTPPISHYFRHNYPDRWFRIHSLPHSQRYPADEKDLEILLGRQNSILSDLLGIDSDIYLVTGEYTSTEDVVELHPLDQVQSISPYNFTRLLPVDMHELQPGLYEKDICYTPMFTKQTWTNNKFNQVLTDVAEDRLQLLFLSVSNNCIVAPYDGGMDIILADTPTRDHYKTKYAAWLSSHPDGL